MRRYYKNDEVQNGMWWVANGVNGRVCIFPTQYERNDIYERLCAREMTWDDLQDYLASND
jgi:hypothetical protein